MCRLHLQVVQQYVKTVTQSVRQATHGGKPGRRGGDAHPTQTKKERQAKARAEREMRMLLGTAAVKKKAAPPPKKTAEEEKAAIDESKLPLEERIELQRQRLPRDGLTPVTEESFAAWKAKRERKRKREET